MNVESLNKQFIEALKTKIPQKTNLAKSIMEELFIGKEAVYRRLRGDVVFTFPEIVSLSRRYGVSIDALAGNLSPNSILFELKPTRISSDLKDIDYGLFKQFADVINSIRDDKTSEMAYSSNMYPQLIYTKYYHLSKLHTLKWLYQQEYLNKHNEPYHLIDYPDDLQELKVKAYNKLKYLHESTYIWDSELFKSIVNDIKYFESVSLITRKEDFEVFKEELHLLLNDLEQLAWTGHFDPGKKVNIYLPNINIDAPYFLSLIHI